MQTEYARQTRWAHIPQLVDPEQTPPGSTYVKHVVWMPCNHCDLQVHATHPPATRVPELLTEGLTCPECGAQLAAPPVRPESRRLAMVLQEERKMHENKEK